MIYSNFYICLSHRYPITAQWKINKSVNNCHMSFPVHSFLYGNTGWIFFFKLRHTGFIVKIKTMHFYFAWIGVPVPKIVIVSDSYRSEFCSLQPTSKKVGFAFLTNNCYSLICCIECLLYSQRNVKVIVGTSGLVAMGIHIYLHKHSSKRKITFLKVYQKRKFIY